MMYIITQLLIKLGVTLYMLINMRKDTHDYMYMHYILD